METVLLNPFLIDIRAYENIDVGFDAVSSYVDGLEELAARSDYSDLIADYCYAGDVADENINIESRIELLKCFTAEKRAWSAGLYQVRSAENGGTSSSVTTPNGSRVSVLVGRKYSYYALSVQDVEADQTDLLSNYPSATIVRNVSSTSSVCTASYNCHSYAWHWTAATNTCWMPDPTLYMTDGSYSQRSGYAVNAKVYYSSSTTNAIHSGIVTSVPTSGQAVVTLKWGYYGVIRHKVYDCPYMSSSTYGNVIVTAWEAN